MLEARAGEAISCPDCGTEVAAHFLICPGCHRLVHADALKRLADEATAANQSGDRVAELNAWRSALGLLPTASRQAATIRSRIDALGDVASTPPPAPQADMGRNPSWAGGAGVAGVGSIGLILWKFKFLGLLLLTKGKLLLFGLTKASTLFSMFLTLGVYWSLWGWPFAVGLVLSIYVHELGHVAALARFGIKTEALMFVPGFGAFVRGQKPLATPREQAQVGLGGPLWGTAGAIACFVGSVGIGSPMLAAIAKLGAFINLLNLIPVWMLDGSLAYAAFSKSQRWFATLAISIAWAVRGEGQDTENVLLFVMMLCSAYQAAFRPAPRDGDKRSLAEFVALLAILTLMTRIDIPLP